VVNNIGSNTVQIAEVSVEKGKVKVHRVVCAVDCGAVVNPAGVAQQIASGIAFGLSALKGGVTIKNGRVEQGNFHQYDVVRMDEMPKVEVHIVPSQAAPGGIGEASTPGIASVVSGRLQCHFRGHRQAHSPVAVIHPEDSLALVPHTFPTTGIHRQSCLQPPFQAALGAVDECSCPERAG
jgi:hypothetical protein